MYDIQVCYYSDSLQPDEDTGLEGIPLETVHWAVMSLVYLIAFLGHVCTWVLTKSAGLLMLLALLSKDCQNCQSSRKLSKLLLKIINPVITIPCLDFS